jgi:hypothetical protein
VNFSIKHIIQLLIVILEAFLRMLNDNEKGEAAG